MNYPLLIGLLAVPVVFSAIVMLTWITVVVGQVRGLRSGSLRKTDPNLIGASLWWVYGSMDV